MGARRPVDPRHVGDGVTRAALLAAGYSQWQAGRGLAAPFTGVRTVHPPLDLLESVRAYAPLLGVGDAFSHRTAALLHGLPVPRSWRPGEPLHVVTADGRWSHRASGVVGHVSDVSAEGVVLIAGVPVVSAVWAWEQLAAQLDYVDLVAIADALLMPPHEVAPDDLVAFADSLSRRRGVVALRQAARDAVVGVRSRPETHVRFGVIEAGFVPVVGQKLFSRDGRYLGTPDVWIEQLAAAIEYEGDYHRTDAVQFRRDIRRREDFESEGHSVMRVVATDIFPSRAPFIARLRARAALRRR